MGTNKSEDSGPENTHRDEHGAVCARVKYDTVQLEQENTVNCTAIGIRTKFKKRKHSVSKFFGMQEKQFCDGNIHPYRFTSKIANKQPTLHPKELERMNKTLNQQKEGNK